MKKQIIFLIGIFICLNLKSQSLLPNKYGVKIGGNMSNLIASSEEGVKNPSASLGYGFAGGFYMQIPINNTLSINPEVLYSQKSSIFEYDYVYDYDVNQRDFYKSKSSITLSFIEVNPTLSFLASYNVSLNIGPSIHYMISNNHEYEQTLTERLDETTAAEVLDDGVFVESSLDIGLNAGLSYYINEDFILNGTLYRGFMKIGEVLRPIDILNNEPTTNIKLSNIRFSLSYLF
tara:strand:- start:5435 stop:6133 length:699 start_codon:yes stop_codon:yes gene_type:complete